MTDALAIQLYRVDNPSGIWEIEDPPTQYFYRDKARRMQLIAQENSCVVKGAGEENEADDGR